MASNSWTHSTLGNIARRDGHGFVDGPFGSNLPASCYVPQGIPVIRGSNLSLGERRFIDEEFVFVSSDTALGLARSLCTPDDIIFTKKGTLGQTGIIPRGHRYSKFLLSSNQMKLSVDCSVADPRFVYYWVSSPSSRDKIARDSEATGVPKINLAYLKSFPIALPPLKEQERIAGILGALDDKIELNRQMNETLEAMARALFKSWFVDFDPVHAKAAVRKQHPSWSNAQVSRAALPNMSPKIAELFPYIFEDSSLGPIPAGWHIAPLSEHVAAAKGLSYKGAGLTESGMPLHNLNSVYEGGGYKFEGLKRYSGEYRERHLIRPGDVIVANTEQGHDCLLIGFAAIVPDVLGEAALFSHHLFRLRILEISPLSPDFLCRLLNSPRMHETVSGYGNGTTVNMLPLDGVQKPEFVLPPPAVIERYTVVAERIRKKCGRFVTENMNLASIRDSLLPKLLSSSTRLTITKE